MRYKTTFLIVFSIHKASRDYIVFPHLSPWHFGTPKWTAGNLWVEPGEDGRHLCRHKCVHASHDVPSHGSVPLPAGLGWGHEIRGEDHKAIQVIQIGRSVRLWYWTVLLALDCQLISFFLPLLLQCALSSLLSEHSFNVPEVRETIFRTGEEVTWSQGFKEGKCPKLKKSGSRHLCSGWLQYQLTSKFRKCSWDVQVDFSTQKHLNS